MLRRALVGLLAFGGTGGCGAPDAHFFLKPVPPMCPRQAASAVRVSLLGDFPPIVLSGDPSSQTALEVPRGTARSVSVEGLSATLVTALGWSGALPGATDPVDTPVPLFYGAPDSLCPVWGLRQGRAFHRTTVLAGGQVVVTGGLDAAGGNDTLEVYPTDAPTVLMPVPLYEGVAIGHSATALPDGTLLVAGGAHPGPAALDGSGGADPARERARIYQPDGTPVGGVLLLEGGPRALHAAVRLPDGRIWLGGGCQKVKGLQPGQPPACDSADVLSTSVVYDPQGGSTPGPGPALYRPRYGHQAFLRGDGQIVLVGGMAVPDAKAKPVPALQAELIDPGDRTIRGVLVGRAGSSAGVLPAGGLLWAGGAGAGAKDGGVLFPDEVAVPAVPQLARAGGELSVFPDGAALLSGGLDDMGQAVGPLELYERGEFHVLADAFPRSGHGATILPDGTVLLTGGMLEKGPTPLVSRFVHSLRLPDATPPSWPTGMEGPSWLEPRRSDLFRFDRTTLELGKPMFVSAGRPLALALFAGVKWAGGELDVTVQFGEGATGAALILGHQSDLDYLFVALLPGKPVSLQGVRGGRVSKVAGCQGQDFVAPPPVGSAAVLRVGNGQVVLRVDGVEALRCQATVPRGAVGLGSLGGVMRFLGFSLTRGG